MPPVRKQQAESVWSGAHVLYLLIALRVCNALLIRTFFQPDEYFQSLEPAWDIAFGPSSGAWITWEWRQRLRSSLHPFLFAAVYRVTALIADALHLGAASRAELSLAAPKLLQAGFAATTDYFIWKLATKAYGRDSRASSAALFLTVFSPWQWFCSTRTLSNSLETTLTTTALWLWPLRNDPKQPGSNATGLRTALALAAIATVLRPTNAIIWIVMAVYTAAPGKDINSTRALWTLAVECREAVISGVSIVAISLASDRLYYGDWTFPPLRFIHFNVVQSLAVFYGRNRPDYYLTEGLPLLLTTTLPFAIWGCWSAFSNKRYSSDCQKMTQPLVISVFIFVSIMSLIGHKEVRFIYPLLPGLLVLAAGPFSQFFSPLLLPRLAVKKVLLLIFVAINVTLALYISQVHQRGVIDVMHHLRHKHQLKTSSNTTIMFMMPCHSTPWRSHLVYPSIDARALTCEPPLDIPIEARSLYLDEADQFYEDPVVWMREHMEDLDTLNKRPSSAAIDIHQDKAQWPEHLVFFEQLEPTMTEYLAKTAYRQCWRGFNTHWHDDWRRQGDVVVWRLGECV
ncbi:glycosyltransferase family 22 protein, partial [Aureobasidium melanogenum]